MRQRFYRPFLGNQVEQYVQSCNVCQKIKSSGQNKQAELQIITPTGTKQIVATDYTGPFIATVRGNRHLMIINDTFSKYLICRPTTNKETTPAANIMKNPRTLVLDFWNSGENF